MDLTVNSKIIAAINALPPSLAPLLGAFELAFPFDATIHGKRDGLNRWLTLDNARVTVRWMDGRSVGLGVARSDEPVHLRQGDGVNRANFTLKLTLLPPQIEMLDQGRDGGDLEFNLALSLTGSDSERFPHDWPEHGDVRIVVPQSTWVAQMNAAEADHILLFELRLPSKGGDIAMYPAAKHLHNAVQLLRAGNWRQCVSECRQFAEELGGSGINEAFNRLARDDRRMMTKSEREAALLAALQHYGHLAAHSESKFGTLDFGRADAKLALSVAAALAAHRDANAA